MIKNVAGLLTCFGLFAAMGWYIPLIVRRRVSPAPATWIIAGLAMNLAAVSYHAIPGRTVIENVTLYAAAFEITIVLVVILVVLHRSGELKVAFDRMQKGCLLVMMAALGYWATHKDQPGITFWTTQTLLVVAYIATIVKAWQKKMAFDSIGNWSMICAASIVGTVPAVMMASPYGITNSVRAVVSSAITVGVLVYYDRRNRGERWQDEKATVADFYGIAK